MLGTASRYHALDLTFSDAHDDVRHDVPESQFDYFPSSWFLAEMGMIPPCHRSAQSRRLWALSRALTNSLLVKTAPAGYWLEQNLWNPMQSTAD